MIEALRRAAGRFRPKHVRFRRGLRDRMRVSRLVHELCGGVVSRGPFGGMRCLPALPDSAAKLLGSYEHELHDVLERVLAEPFRHIVNVGCSDGYYAVGCGLRVPGAQVHAFDLSTDMQRHARGTAEANDLHVEVHGLCTPTAIEAIASNGPTLVLCDCEGCEYDLLDPRRSPSLANASLVVELHQVSGASLQEFLDRFALTHRLTVVESVPRDPGQYPELAPLNDHDRRLAVFERPEPQSWAVLEPLGAQETARA